MRRAPFQFSVLIWTSAARMLSLFDQGDGRGQILVPPQSLELTALRSGAMRRFAPRFKRETLMYSAPKIIASMDASAVLTEALGQNCSQVTWCG